MQNWKLDNIQLQNKHVVYKIIKTSPVSKHETSVVPRKVLLNTDSPQTTNSQVRGRTNLHLRFNMRFRLSLSASTVKKLGMDWNFFSNNCI